MILLYINDFQYKKEREPKKNSNWKKRKREKRKTKRMKKMKMDQRKVASCNFRKLGHASEILQFTRYTTTGSVGNRLSFVMEILEHILVVH